MEEWNILLISCYEIIILIDLNKKTITIHLQAVNWFLVRRY